MTDHPADSPQPVAASRTQSPAWKQACKDVFSTPILDIRAKFGTGDLYAAIQKRADELEAAPPPTSELVKELVELVDALRYTGKASGMDREDMIRDDIAAAITAILERYSP